MVTNDLINELGTNFIEYSVEVNSNRAIPDSTTGLKPVAKRILWGAYEMGASSKKPHVKSATIVGNIIGHYHPHGESSVYQAMTRLAQDWIMRYPLIDWHGNKGNIIGSSAASSRYTEARLSKLSENGMLDGIKKKNVPFTLNFTETCEEPVTLPSLFPNLLCNPNSGIGVAIACNWACHNLREVAQAIYDYMDGKEPMLPGPDFPTGGIVINKNDIPKIMQTGHGSVKIRGRYKVEKNNIVFYEVPYGVTIENLLNEIAEVCETKEIEGINHISDESNKNGIRIVIECGRGYNPEDVVLKLFAKTSLQSSFSYNQVALVDKTPTELNLKDCIRIYVDHNVECIKKEATFDLEKIQARLHVLEGLIIALEDIDNIIQKIKSSNSPSDAKKTLMESYKLSDVQAQSILDMKLSKLAKLEKVELESERKQLEKRHEDLQILLTSAKSQLSLLKKKLEELVIVHGDERRTQITQIEIQKEIKIKPEFVPEDCVVVVNYSRTIKRISPKNFKTRARNTKGVKGEEIASYTLRTNTADVLFIFSDGGKLYRLPVNSIPEGTMTGQGTAIKELISMPEDENPIVYTSLNEETIDNKFVFFATELGVMKIVPLKEYNLKRNGVLTIKLKEDDRLASAFILDGQKEILAVTRNGYAIRIAVDSFSVSSRTAQGVKGMNVIDGDCLLAAVAIDQASKTLVVVTEDGLGKRISLDEFTSQNRGGKGVKCSKGEIGGICLSDSDSDKLLISSTKGSLTIEAEQLPILGKTANGVITMKDSIITSVARI